MTTFHGGEARRFNPGPRRSGGESELGDAQSGICFRSQLIDMLQLLVESGRELAGWTRVGVGGGGGEKLSACAEMTTFGDGFALCGRPNEGFCPE
ncbi:hypothetical protein [Micromonospora carbonacea]|uniref:Uncharacterized protein n=1 Tax=Micromonospora carbonacea TaxID=47853 RepID=A0A7H8XSI8_9ACTN|nr:hypothetical protein [Micromonospora carbonacea]MBB5830106.1 hypothetical protein [Micromonospora carbonacea]QLD27973.1 hypothetical protein HXZ27_30305 [Micromonospora carbonacea]